HKKKHEPERLLIVTGALVKNRGLDRIKAFLLWIGARSVNRARLDHIDIADATDTFDELLDESLKVGGIPDAGQRPNCAIENGQGVSELLANLAVFRPQRSTLSVCVPTQSRMA